MCFSPVIFDVDDDDVDDQNPPPVGPSIVAVLIGFAICYLTLGC